jgi:transitional endoplasmic reticulum ATPase
MRIFFPLQIGNSKGDLRSATLYLMDVNTKIIFHDTDSTPDLKWMQNVKIDFPGYDDELVELEQILNYSVENPKHAIHGVLVIGEAGIGKSHLASLIRESSSGNCISLDVVQLLADDTGDLETKIHAIFNRLYETTPSIMLIDNLEKIAAKKASIYSKQILLEFLISLDELSKKNLPIVVIGFCRSVDDIYKPLISAKRFERVIELRIPSSTSRSSIISHFFTKHKIPLEYTTYVCEHTMGFVKAEIHRIILEASLNSSVAQQDLSQIHFENVLKNFQPNRLQKMVMSKTLKKVTLQDFVGFDEIKERIRLSILDPMRNFEKYSMIGIDPPRGVLLYGPSGTGKSLCAQAIANEIQANFVSVQCTDILSKYTGESSKTISELFKKARSSSPCLLFFDQFEAIARSRTEEGSSQGSDRMLSTLLIEMDGITNYSDGKIIVLAATNRIDLLDIAVLRPGRLDQQIAFKIPNTKTRIAILEQKTKGKPLHHSVILADLASTTKGYSPADLENLVREAAMIALMEGESTLEITNQHFQKALANLNIQSD